MRHLFIWLRLCRTVRLQPHLYLFMLFLLLTAGCAGPGIQSQPAPYGRALPSPQPQPLPQPPQIPTHSRTFPEFVAVIAQPGDTFSSLAAQYLNNPSLDWFISEFNETDSLHPGQELVIPLDFFEKGGLAIGGYQTVPVIAYHKFSKNGADVMTVKGQTFEEQMSFLKRNGYRVISLEALFDFLDFKIQIPKKSVVITIDDGWRSAYEIAFPILKRYGYPATLFVYTDFISQGNNALDWGLIKEMAKNGIDVQCHTKTHRNLGRKANQESFREYFEAVKRELTESARIIKKNLNKDVRYLAYPFGDTNSLIVALLKKLGYRGAFTVERDCNPFFTHPYRMKRAMIYGNFGLKDFENTLAVFTNKALH